MVIRPDPDLLVSPYPGSLQMRHLFHGLGLDFDAFDNNQYRLRHRLSFHVEVLRRRLRLFQLHLPLFIHARRRQVILTG